MIYLLQVFNLLGRNEKQLFLDIFNDLSFEIEDLDYKGFESDLINDMLFNHFGLEIECDRQLYLLTKSILKHQGQLNKMINTVDNIRGL